MNIDNNSIARAWIEYTYLPDEDRDETCELFWAWEKLNNYIYSDPEKAWNIINIIIEYNQSDQILANLAAGPVESLLVHKGYEFVERFVERASSDPIFKKMLGGVWGNDIPINVWSKIQSVAGPSF